MPAGARPQARKKPEAYSLEYVEDFFRAENETDACRSFAAVEMALLGQAPSPDNS
jgi:hypothetical protein